MYNNNLCYSTITLFCRIRSREHAQYTVFLEEDETEKMAGLDETNFDLLSAFKLSFQSSVAHFIQYNRTNFIGFLFCRGDEAYTLGMKSGKVAAFCALVKNIDACHFI